MALDKSLKLSGFIFLILRWGDETRGSPNPFQPQHSWESGCFSWSSASWPPLAPWLATHTHCRLSSPLPAVCFSYHWPRGSGTLRVSHEHQTERDEEGEAAREPDCREPCSSDTSGVSLLKACSVGCSLPGVSRRHKKATGTPLNR